MNLISLGNQERNKKGKTKEGKQLLKKKSVERDLEINGENLMETFRITHGFSGCNVNKSSIWSQGGASDTEVKEK